MEKDEMVLIIEFVSLAKKFLSNSSYVKIKSILYDELGFISDEGIGEISGPMGLTASNEDDFENVHVTGIYVLNGQRPPIRKEIVDAIAYHAVDIGVASEFHTATYDYFKSLGIAKRALLDLKKVLQHDDFCKILEVVESAGKCKFGIDK